MPKVLILYHYYWPDDVVSAQQFTGLAEGLTYSETTEPDHLKGSAHTSPAPRFEAPIQWLVEVWPCNRKCHTSNSELGIRNAELNSFSTQPENLNNVMIRRIWRPAFRQHSFMGRILNSIWMQKAWFWRLLLSPSLKPDIIIIGTDPLFSVGLVPFLKFIRPKAKVAHWAFDLYPEAAVADDIVRESNPLVKLLRFGLKRAYKQCDLVADLGPCMREKLKVYGIGTATQTAPSPGANAPTSPLDGEGKQKKTKVVTLTHSHSPADGKDLPLGPSPATGSTGLTVRGEGENQKPKVVTLTPWALEEPPLPRGPQAEGRALSAPSQGGGSSDPTAGLGGALPFDVQERKELFGESKLALLYSGSFGRAHDYPLTLMLARRMRAQASFCYSARGSRLDELKRFITPEDANIRFTDFAPQEKLAARLSSPDVHIVSLRPEWTGTVVPSKFFGALAIGRPVLFEGGAGRVSQNELGTTKASLSAGGLKAGASSIAHWIEEYKVGWVLKTDNLDEIAKELIQFSGNENKKAAMFKHCHEIYRKYFSKKAVIDRWKEELKKLGISN